MKVNAGMRCTLGFPILYNCRVFRHTLIRMSLKITIFVFLQPFCYGFYSDIEIVLPTRRRQNDSRGCRCRALAATPAIRSGFGGALDRMGPKPRLRNNRRLRRFPLPRSRRRIRGHTSVCYAYDFGRTRFALAGIDDAICAVVGHIGG